MEMTKTITDYPETIDLSTGVELTMVLYSDRHVVENYRFSFSEHST